MKILFRFTQKVRVWNRKRLNKRRSFKWSEPQVVPEGIVNLDFVPPTTAEPRVAIHIHLFYADLIEFFTPFLERMPNEFDLLVSCSGDVTPQKIKKAYSKLPLIGKIIVIPVKNIGRDIAPFLCDFASQIMEYDLIAHLHGKKSLYNGGSTTGWLEYLAESLLPSNNEIKKIYNLLLKKDGYGLIYPLNYVGLPYQANTWLANRSRSLKLAKHFGIKNLPDSYIDYPAGSMFWAKTEAITPLLRHGFKTNDFDPECGQTDGTLAHAIERMFGFIVKANGYKVGILQDKSTPSSSPWRIEKFFSHKREDIKSILNQPKVKLIGFDIFDTLICRPLVDPDHTKKLIASRLPAETASLFMEYRTEAENLARNSAGRDIGLKQIYETFQKLTNINERIAQEILTIEEDIEQKSLRRREDGVALLNAAIASGKKVVLISDMFLSKETITRSLHDLKISGWDELFVSSEIGCRKDSGQLYKHVMEKFDIQPQQMLMIGDNERSDWQIPTDLGMSTFHVLKPSNIAAAHTRFSPILNIALSKPTDENINLTAGLIILKEYSNIFYNNYSNQNIFYNGMQSIGRSVLAPMLCAFSEWLVKSNKDNSGTKLFFLAREGETLKIAYDEWVSEEPGRTPDSAYLVLSRRCVTVASIVDFEDIQRIAKTDYFGNTVAHFLQERFGVCPTEERWDRIMKSTGFSAGDSIIIKNGDISSITPLLQEVEHDIQIKAEEERVPLLKYLDDIGLTSCQDPVLVDVGYSGTIQSALNKILNRKIRGQYLATSRKIKDLYPTGTLAQGFFADGMNEYNMNNSVLRESFMLEKLLSSNSSQVICYSFSENRDSVTANFKKLSESELNTQQIRKEIRDGLIDFIRDAKLIKRSLKDDFWPSAEVATLAYDCFISNPSHRDMTVCKGLVLDDDYCGRGIVN